MASNSKFLLLTWLTLALYLFSVVYAFFTFEPIEREPLYIETISYYEDTIEKVRFKKQLLHDSIYMYDTMYVDTFSRTSDGLKRAINLHRHIDSITSELLSR
jgi:hypothetical protein